MSQRITDLKELIAWNANPSEKLPIVAEWFYDHWMKLVTDENWTAANDHYVAMIRFHELCNKVEKEIAAEEMYQNIHSYAKRGNPWRVATKEFFRHYPRYEYDHQNMQNYQMHCITQRDLGLEPLALRPFLTALTYGDEDLAKVLERSAPN